MTNKVFLDDNFESYAKENGLGIFFKDDINKGYSSEGYFKDNKGFLNIRTNKEETAYYSDEITAETLMVKVYEKPWSSSTNETEVLDISDKLDISDFYNKIITFGEYWEDSTATFKAGKGFRPIEFN